jgi:predicted DCC family thiol-disulfide oxidoreductase YuxK
MTGPSVLVFDGDCGFCTSAAVWASKQFRRGEIMVPWQRLSADELVALRLHPSDVANAAWWVDEQGARSRGSRAAGRALVAGGGWRWVVGWLFLLPPASWIAAVVFHLVVRWRYKLPGGTPACQWSDADTIT